MALRLDHHQPERGMRAACVRTCETESDPHEVEYRNGPLGAAMPDPNPSRFDPAFAVLDRVVDQDVAALRMHPFFACLTATDLDLGTEMFAHPGAFVCGRLGDLLWNASQNDRLIALDPVPKQLQVRHGRN